MLRLTRLMGPAGMDKSPGDNRIMYILVLGLAIAVHFTGLLNELFLSDSALYGSIAKEMAGSNDYLNLTFNGRDWLDKPHFPFWISALSFKVLGVSAFAFKLPAILFTMLGLLYTYRFTREWYDRDTAMIAVLVLATAEHLVISDNDVRAEPYLTGMIIASVYHYHRLVRNFRLRPLFFASLFAAFAVMTKGLFTLIPIIGAVAGELLIKRNRQVIFRWRWAISFLLIFIFIIPELYAVYYQFDLHPEKIIFGHNSVSGIRFFLWDSQIGRFLNNGPIKGKGDPFFFLHTLLWAFLPWALLMYYSLFRKIRENLPRINPGNEFYSITGALSALLVFSLSGFQLPHYTNIIFPFLAILTAGFIGTIHNQRGQRFFRISQWSHIVLIIGFMILIQLVFRPQKIHLIALAGFLLAAALTATLLVRIRGYNLRIFYLTCIASIFLNLFLNLIFYPELLEYQSGVKAARYINREYPGKETCSLGILPFTLSFYTNAPVKDFRNLDELKACGVNECLLFTRKPYLDSLDQSGIHYEVESTFQHYHITALSGKFLNYRTRPESLQYQYLVKIEP